MPTINGGSSTVTNTAGFAVSGTSIAGAGTLDGTYYQSTNVLGVTGPTVRTMFSTMVENGYNLGTGRGGGPVYYGGVFSNPTGSALTVTRVDVTLSGTNFFDLVAGSTTPAAGWALISGSIMRWTGSQAVAANSGQAFIFASQTLFTNAAANYTASMTVFVGATSYVSTSFTEQVPGSSLPYGTDAVVGFDTLSAATWAPQTYVSTATITPGSTVNFSVRVRETGNNSADQNGIAQNLNLVLSIPAGWSAVSIPTATTPWRAAGTATIVQPTALTAGSVSITTLNSTSGQIDHGTSSPANTLVIRATAPAGSYASSLFPFTFQLNGTTQGTGTEVGPVASKNESIVRVTSATTAGVNTEFLSPVLTVLPVRQIDFSAAFNATSGSGSDVVSLDVFNPTTSAWTNIGSATPTALNSTLTRTFTTDFEQFVNASHQMRVRLVSTGTTGRVIGVDRLQWITTTGYTVNNAAGVGNDANPGNIARPFATLSKATSSLPAFAGSGAVYVEVGASQTGSPYAVNPIVTGAGQAGTAACATLFQGVPNGSGLRPLVRGANPAADAGFDIDTDFVKVDSFEIGNSLVGVYTEPTTVSATLSNNLVHVPDLAYGMILDTTSLSLVSGNRVDATGTGSFFGIWDYVGAGNTIDDNTVTGQASDGIRSDNSNVLTVQRNVVSGNRIGIDIAHSTGAVKLYNNTADASSYLGFYAESPSGTVTSRNNIIMGSAVAGWGWNGIGTIDSNYDDVFNNTSNYVFHGTVAPGGNSISASPSFVQTSNPALATYYKLNAGSPCIDKGVNVGLTFLGAAPDIGGVESQ